MTAALSPVGVQLLAQVSGTRLTRADLAARLGCHRNTLADRVKQPGFPKPKSDGKWLLADVIEWEQRR